MRWYFKRILPYILARSKVLSNTHVNAPAILCKMNWPFASILVQTVRHGCFERLRAFRGKLFVESIQHSSNFMTDAIPPTHISNKLVENSFNSSNILYMTSLLLATCAAH